jgi:hypothetical protein
MSRRLALAVLSLAIACTSPKSSFNCVSDSQCQESGAQGVCEINAYCSYPDPSCLGAGRRYSESAPSALNNACVGAEAALPVIHLDPTEAYCGNSDLDLKAPMTIDTDALTLDGAAPPAGVAFDATIQLGSQSSLAVLHIRQGTLDAGVTLRAIGSRPLVIVACGDIVLAPDALLDASAHGSQPGAGGAMPGQGLGAGGRGSSGAGGGGAGFAQPGAKGGDDNANLGGDGGAAYGDASLSVLQAGSGGGLGDPSICAPDLQLGGAGGGAVQLFSLTRIAIAGAAVINAGGGGGAGGYAGALCEAYGAGSGGGSGGAVLLQARLVDNAGTVSANGGAGGGGACDAPIAACQGGAGQDGAWGSGPASPGQPGQGAVCGTVGGAGGTGTAAPNAAPDDGCLTGGGGGAAGRVVTIQN